jgi:hypothetical protein
MRKTEALIACHSPHFVIISQMNVHKNAGPSLILLFPFIQYCRGGILNIKGFLTLLFSQLFRGVS